MNSRQKGKRIELELVHKLKEVFGWESVARSQQYCGRAGDSDLQAPEAPTLFIESKGVQNLNLHRAMEVAVSQAGGMTAVVCHKKNRTGWLVTMRIEEVPAFVSLMTKALSDTPAGPREGQSEKPIT